MREENVKRLGGMLVALAAALFAHHSGMPSWQVGAVFLLIALGLQLLVVGRLRMSLT